MVRRSAAGIGLALATLANAQDSATQQLPPTAPSVADSVLEARTSALAARLRCPVCQGESINDSPAALAQEMRAVIRDQLREGKSEAEVTSYFVGRYGEWILLDPIPRGFNLVVYVVPVLGVLAGLTIIAIAVKRWTRPA